MQSHDRKELRRLDAVMGLRFDTDQHEIFLRLRGWPMGGGVVCGPHMPWAPPWRGLPHDREMLQLLLQQSISTPRPENISTVYEHTYHLSTFGYLTTQSTLRVAFRDGLITHKDL